MGWLETMFSRDDFSLVKIVMLCWNSELFSHSPLANFFVMVSFQSAIKNTLKLSMPSFFASWQSQRSLWEIYDQVRVVHGNTKGINDVLMMHCSLNDREIGMILASCKEGMKLGVSGLCEDTHKAFLRLNHGQWEQQFQNSRSLAGLNHSWRTWNKWASALSLMKEATWVGWLAGRTKDSTSRRLSTKLLSKSTSARVKRQRQQGWYDGEVMALPMLRPQVKVFTPNRPFHFSTGTGRQRLHSTAAILTIHCQQTKSHFLIFWKKIFIFISFWALRDGVQPDTAHPPCYCPWREVRRGSHRAVQMRHWALLVVLGLLRHRVGILRVGQQAVRVRLQRQESVHLRLVGHQAVHEVLTDYKTIAPLDIRKGHGTRQKVVKTAKSRTTLCVVSTSRGWTKLNDGTCCSAKYLSVEQQQQQQCYYAVTDGKCGIGHGSCEQLGSGHCCTRWGRCGKSTAHCGSGKNQCRCECTGKKPCCPSGRVDTCWACSGGEETVRRALKNENGTRRREAKEHTKKWTHPMELQRATQVRKGAWEHPLPLKIRWFPQSVAKGEHRTQWTKNKIHSFFS